MKLEGQLQVLNALDKLLRKGGAREEDTIGAAIYWQVRQLSCEDNGLLLHVLQAVIEVKQRRRY